MANGSCVSNVMLMDLLQCWNFSGSWLCHHPALLSALSRLESQPVRLCRGFHQFRLCSACTWQPSHPVGVQTVICEHAELQKGIPGLVITQEPHQFLMWLVVIFPIFPYAHNKNFQGVDILWSYTHSVIRELTF